MHFDTDPYGWMTRERRRRALASMKPGELVEEIVRLEGMLDAERRATTELQSRLERTARKARA